MRLKALLVADAHGNLLEYPEQGIVDNLTAGSPFLVAYGTPSFFVPNESPDIQNVSQKQQCEMAKVCT
jgi:hypothetical protein